MESACEPANCPRQLGSSLDSLGPNFPLCEMGNSFPCEMGLGEGNAGYVS